MFAKVKTRSFMGPQAAASLTQALNETTKYTRLLRIDHPTMCKFDSLGRLGAKFQLTRPAASEFGARLAKHMGSSLLDLADTAENEQEVEVIAEVMTDLAHSRFRSLNRWKWVLDLRDNTAVGLIGPKYRVVKNSDFWSRIERTCLGESDRPRLFSAVLYGRNMDIVMAGKDVVSVGGVTFARGVLAQNAETSGRAMRAANVLISTKDGSWACDNFYADTRIPHIQGKKFDSRMAQIYSRLRQRRVPQDSLRESWQRATKQRLTKADMPVDAAIKSVARLLREQGLGQVDAMEAAENLVARFKQPVVAHLLPVLGRQASGRNDANAIKCRQIVYSFCFNREKKSGN
jgi:hypothetical protein